MFTFAFLFTWKMQTFGMAETFDFIGKWLPYTLSHTNVCMFTENEKSPFEPVLIEGYVNMQTCKHSVTACKRATLMGHTVCHRRSNGQNNDQG